MLRKIFIPLLAMGFLFLFAIYQKYPSPASTTQEPNEVPLSRGPLLESHNAADGLGLEKAQPRAGRESILDADELVRELKAIVDELTSENVQLHRENEALSARLAGIQIRLSELESAGIENYRNNNQAGIEKLYSSEKFDLEKDGEVIYLYDKSGHELFEFDLDHQKLSFHDGLYLSPLNTILFNTPEFVDNLRSAKGKDKAVLTFENTLSDDIYLFWMDYKGNPKHYRTLKPGEKHTQHTYMTHPWIMTDKKGNIHSDIEPLYTNQHEDIIITE